QREGLRDHGAAGGGRDRASAEVALNRQSWPRTAPSQVTDAGRPRARSFLFSRDPRQLLIYRNVATLQKRRDHARRIRFRAVENGGSVAAAATVVRHVDRGRVAPRG